nr:hypothetical protein GCM10020093_063110 [Planobispora longispora]
MDWRPDRPVDVIVSNAVLQWVPEHRDLLSRWVEALAPGGWLAFQVPGNFDAPSHVILRDLCRTKWLEWLGDLVRNEPVGSPAEYLERLAALGCAVDAWETTYLHVLPGENAVLHWVSGTALRPVIDRLPRRAQRVHRRLRGPAERGLPAPAVRHRLPLPENLRRGAQARPWTGRGGSINTSRAQ